MAPTIVPLDTTLGATVTDIDLASMDHATWKCVEDAFHEYAALIFPAQDLSADEQVAFSLRFGKIEHLRAYHSLYASQAKIGYVVETGSGYGYHTKGAPLRPLVRVHPVTGRKSLCIGRHAYRIDGLDDDAAQGLLDELLEFACQPPRIHIQNWQPGDLIIWDNRCVMHRARPYDFNETRIMQATRIAGDPATDLAPTARDGRASGFKPATTNEIEAPAF